jgi:type II secretory pathway predicted ATPase ExeA
MLRLKLIVERLAGRGRANQADLAQHLSLSRAALANWLNHERWPTRRTREALHEQVTAWLHEHGALAEEVQRWADPVPAATAARHIGPARGRGAGRPARTPAAAGQPGTAPEDTREDTREDTTMLLRGTKLSPDARRAFGLPRDPFRDEIRSAEDLYLTPDARYCREAMRATAEHGGMTAIVGESGSGKTTLRDDLHDWVQAGGDKVVLIEPYVIDMEERGSKRRTLPAREIAAAIVHRLAPQEAVRQDSQARFRQVHRLLEDSHRAGHRHCLLIEEAHDLPVTTLRHLKRYLELRSGHVPLLSVLLLGQPELGYRLSELDASIREIVQRCEVVQLTALDGRLTDYLRHKFSRVGADLERILAADAVAAIAERLTLDAGRGRAGAGPVSLLYPLAVANLCAAALNHAVRVGMDGRQPVGADVVAEV